MIRRKYEKDRGGWSSREVREARGMGLWKGIRMDWELVGSRISFRVENGRRESFSRNRWCEDSPLCVSFPSLFALSTEKEAWVANVWDPSAEGDWSPYFSRALNDWEVKEAERFLEHLHGRE